MKIGVFPKMQRKSLILLQLILKPYFYQYSGYFAIASRASSNLRPIARRQPINKSGNLS